MKTFGNGIAPLSRCLDEQEIETLNSYKSLQNVFEKHLPTKQGHNYNPLFERHFQSIRENVTRVLEIGVEAGTSLRFWKDYFPNAEITDFDINPRCKDHEEERIKIVVGDQNNTADLEGLDGDYDIIIDDGLHTPESQIGCFEYLFRNKLKQRGIYVVEDVVGCYPTQRYFQDLFKFVNFWPMDLPGEMWSQFDSQSLFDSALEHFNEQQKYYILNVLGLSVYRHIIFVDKGRDPIDGQAAYRLNNSEQWKQMGEVRASWLEQ